MVDSRQNIMEKAELRFLETQKKTADRAKATIEYQTEAKLRATKTARLRELRLAKDEAARAAEALRPAEPTKKRARTNSCKIRDNRQTTSQSNSGAA